MLADAVARYMQGLVNDPDNVSFPPSLRAIYLQVAYDEFRGMCPDEFFEVSYTPTALSSAYSVDLSGLLFQTQAVPTLPGGVAPAQRFTRILQVDPNTGAMISLLTPAASFEGLRQIAGLGAASLARMSSGVRWWLDGNVLRFNVPITGTLQIWYVPNQTINWSAAIATGAGIFLDKLNQFHDVIALIAAQQYYAAQGQGNPALQSQFARRAAQMEAFFAETRSGIASRSVTDVGGSYGW